MKPLKPTRWWWIRHAPAASVEGVFPPRDAALKPLSISPQLLRALLPQQAVWLSSPLPRCIETLAWLAPGQPYETEPALAEQSFGAWEGMSYQEVWEATRESAGWNQPETLQPPGGESFAALTVRVEKALAQLSQKHAGKEIICLAHSGVIRAALRLSWDATFAEALAIEVAPLSVTCLAYADGMWEAQMVNRLA